MWNNEKKSLPWQRKYNEIYYSILQKIETINSIFPITLQNKKINSLEDVLVELEKDWQLKYRFNEKYHNIISNEEIGWLYCQKQLFDNGELTVDRIEKLKLLGLFEKSQRFNDDDKYVFDLYFKNISDIENRKEYSKENNWQLKIAKYIVLKYYYRRENQDYDIRDYIEIVLTEIIESVKENPNINFKPLERKVLNKIKKINKPNEIEKVEMDEQQYLMDEEIDFSFLKEYIKEILGEFSERNRKIIKYRYGIVDEENDNTKPHTLAECSKKFGISRATISQIEHKIFRNIKRYNKKEITDYVDPKLQNKPDLFSIYSSVYYEDLFKTLKEYQKRICLEASSKGKAYFLMKDEIIDFFVKGYSDESTLSEIEYVLKTTNDKIILENRDKVLKQIEFARSIQDKIKPRYIK